MMHTYDTMCNLGQRLFLMHHLKMLTKFSLLLQERLSDSAFNLVVSKVCFILYM